MGPGTAWLPKNNGMMKIRLLPNGLDPNFSFLLWFVNLIFPITHSVNSSPRRRLYEPEAQNPVFHHSLSREYFEQQSFHN